MAMALMFCQMEPISLIYLLMFCQMEPIGLLNLSFTSLCFIDDLNVVALALTIVTISGITFHPLTTIFLINGCCLLVLG